MPIRRFVLSATAVFGLATYASACADVRAQEFCATVCECIADDTGQDVVGCTNSCADSINAAEESSGERILTDECFTCATTTSCDRLNTACANECESISDAFDTPQPDPVPEPDPRPGDQ